MSRIVDLYNDIYSHYRLVNSLLTLGLDGYWRRKTINLIRKLNAKPLKICDICCGSGDFTELLVKDFVHSDIFGIDANPNMLKMAEKRVSGAKFILAGIGDMPFTDNVFDIMTISFATRNIFYSDNFEKNINEIMRVLKPDGYLISVETDIYKNRIMNVLFKIYLEISVRIISLIFGGSMAYRFLKSSIIKFDANLFVKKIEPFFKEVKIINLFPFPVSVVVAQK